MICGSGLPFSPDRGLRRRGGNHSSYQGPQGKRRGHGSRRGSGMLTLRTVYLAGPTPPGPPVAFTTSPSHLPSLCSGNQFALSFLSPVTQGDSINAGSSQCDWFQHT